MNDFVLHGKTAKPIVEIVMKPVAVVALGLWLTASACGSDESNSSSGAGNTTANGSSTSTAGSCSRAVGSCTAPEVRVTEIELGIAVTAYGDDGWDTLPLPMAIAAMPSGGSRLAWLGTDSSVHVAELDCDDQLVGTPLSFPAEDLQDLHADDDGGVLMITREVDCGDASALCNAATYACYDSFLLRFDESGAVEWTTKVTNSSESLSPYEDGARFVWEAYQHHGRIAFGGSNYAAYFSIGITVQNDACVDIHEGDRMQLVSSTGALQTSSDEAFEWGLSHSWTPRVVWDPRTSRFVTTAATDNGCRIAVARTDQTVAAGECNGTLFNGDLALASDEGYWGAWSQDGTIRLQKFATDGVGTAIGDIAGSVHPHLASYGNSNLLLAWGSGSTTAAHIRDASSGAMVGTPFTIDADDHNYQGFKAFSDGSVAFPAAGSGTSIKIARVMPCN